MEHIEQRSKLDKKYSKLRHGTRIKACYFPHNNQWCYDAVISINKYGKKFICQDIRSGEMTDNLFEFKYSYKISNYKIFSSQRKVVESIKLYNNDYNRKIIKIKINIYDCKD